ncbi:hypothetical protein LINGRAHAP2_LOCUS5285 [Linum grandiflorum]
MAKGNRPRLLTTSHSERFLGSAYSSYSNGGNHDTTADSSSEFGEEDVWSTVDSYDHDHMSNGNDDSMGEWGSFANNIMSTRDGHVGGLSLAFEEDINNTAGTTRIVHQFLGHANRQPRQFASSAPVKVPDWGKILRINETFDYNDSEEEMMPPHEYLARANSINRKVGGASVFEGVGRTLKGRDLRRVRDAVWSQTGFNG